MPDFCGPLQTRFAQTVHGPQPIAAIPVPSACNNLFTRDTAYGCAVLLTKSKGSQVHNPLLHNDLPGNQKTPKSPAGSMQNFCGDRPHLSRKSSENYCFTR